MLLFKKKFPMSFPEVSRRGAFGFSTGIKKAAANAAAKVRRLIKEQ
jgi:hypothetical protein